MAPNLSPAHEARLRLFLDEQIGHLERDTKKQYVLSLRFPSVELTSVTSSWRPSCPDCAPCSARSSRSPTPSQVLVQPTS